jgi:outer membrane protein TolC
MEQCLMRHFILIAAVLSCPSWASGQTLRLNAQPDAAAAQAAPLTRPLSVDDAVALALEQNLGLRIERVNPQVQDVAVAQARSLWAPQVTSTLSRNSANIPNTSLLAGTQERVTRAQLVASAGLDELLPWGGSYSVTWNNFRTTTSDPSNLFNPNLQAQLQASYVQPLLRDFTIDAARQQLEIGRIARETADVGLRAAIVQTARSVRNAYWDLAFAIDNLDAQRQSLELAERQLQDNQRRVQIGTMAPIDVVDAEAEVARNEEAVIVAEAAIAAAQDRLRALIFDPAMPDFWNVAIVPTDAAPYQVQAIDVDTAVQRALAGRTDLEQARQGLARSDVALRYYRNQALPEINAQINYSAIGVGGAQLERIDLFQPGSGLSRDVVARRSYGAALADVLQSSYPTWTFSVSVGYPLGTSTDEANLARERLLRSQAETQLRNQELQIAAEVREAARQVETNRKRVDSTRAARELAERRLDAAQKKFAAGIETGFFVFQAQRDLAQARTGEVRAISDYNKSLVDFEAVQEVPLR